MISEIRKYFAGTLIVVYIFYIVFVVSRYIKSPNYLYQTDLMASFLTGAMVIREGDADKLYNLDTQLEYQNKVTVPVIRNKLLPFRNTPLVGFFYIPLTFLTLKNAFIVVFVFNILLLIFFNKLFIRFTGKSNNTLLLWMISLFFWPSVATLLTGQNTGAFLVLLTLIYILILKKRYFLSGVVGSFMLLRPQCILFLPFLLPFIGEKKKFLIGFLTFAFLLLIANIIVSGYPVLLKYPNFVMASEIPEFGNRLNKITSVYFLFKQYFPNTSSSAGVLINCILYTFVLILCYLFNNKSSFDKNYIIGILAISIFSIHSLSHDLIVLLIPIYLLLTKDKRSLSENVLVTLLFLSPIMTLFINATYITIVIFCVIFLVLFYYPGKEVRVKEFAKMKPDTLKMNAILISEKFMKHSKKVVSKKYVCH
jgi:hypothetical protein